MASQSRSPSIECSLFTHEPVAIFRVRNLCGEFAPWTSMSGRTPQGIETIRLCFGHVLFPPFYVPSLFLARVFFCHPIWAFSSIIILWFLKVLQMTSRSPGGEDLVLLCLYAVFQSYVFFLNDISVRFSSLAAQDTRFRRRLVNPFPSSHYSLKGIVTAAATHQRQRITLEISQRQQTRVKASDINQRQLQYGETMHNSSKGREKEEKAFSKGLRKCVARPGKLEVTKRDSPRLQFLIASCSAFQSNFLVADRYLRIKMECYQDEYELPPT
ncbi:uncharacterized protein BDR25DRAFT_360308 [Lindgomyces ingoldianus]|uniref:Uncharacterized protein n=1 Tax=Lindgomyces ingoldianus TaxID=673940 RepID=A0ACB6QFX1_9PLEO|nr:uncharacterized protein BDR25DRAFT_360308 [Lindgomyces ingoldianus]KAF2465780.1 hypothetical protein BDR25DRAFT_360308 [Lindgomyces ingoldianus]